MTDLRYLPDWTMTDVSVVRLRPGATEDGRVVTGTYDVDPVGDILPATIAERLAELVRSGMYKGLPALRRGSCRATGYLHWLATGNLAQATNDEGEVDL